MSDNLSVDEWLEMMVRRVSSAVRTIVAEGPSKNPIEQRFLDLIVCCHDEQAWIEGYALLAFSTAMACGPDAQAEAIMALTNLADKHTAAIHPRRN